MVPSLRVRSAAFACPRPTPFLQNQPEASFRPARHNGIATSGVVLLAMTGGAGIGRTPAVLRGHGPVPQGPGIAYPDKTIRPEFQ